MSHADQREDLQERSCPVHRECDKYVIKGASAETLHLDCLPCAGALVRTHRMRLPSRGVSLAYCLAEL